MYFLAFNKIHATIKNIPNKLNISIICMAYVTHANFLGKQQSLDFSKTEFGFTKP
jgi:hypothetical protein